MLVSRSFPARFCASRRTTLSSVARSRGSNMPTPRAPVPSKGGRSRLHEFLRSTPHHLCDGQVEVRCRAFWDDWVFGGSVDPLCAPYALVILNTREGRIGATLITAVVRLDSSRDSAEGLALVGLRGRDLFSCFAAGRPSRPAGQQCRGSLADGLRGLGQSTGCLSDQLGDSAGL
jgi:hypothetical protein